VKYIFKTRFFIVLSLVFSFWLAGCSGKNTEANEISIVWENEKAVAFLIPGKFIESFPADSVAQVLKIQLEQSAVPVFGEYYFKNNGVEFRPILSFTPGL
jgi:hypothetical protein